MLFFKQRFTTVDIGSHSIKAVRMEKNGGNIKILKTGYLELPEDSVVDGEVKDTSMVATQLEEVFKKMGYRPSRIVTTVPNNYLFIRNVELPAIPDEELVEAIKWEADEFLPFPVDEAKVKHFKVGTNDENLVILLVAIKNEIVENYLEPFNKIGLKPEVVNVQPMALLSLLEYQGELAEPIAVINIGASGTQIAIGDSNNIYLSRMLDVGGNEFSQSLMESMNISYGEAEEYKINNGIKDLGQEEQGYQDPLALEVAATGMSSNSIMQNLADNLSNEISRSLNFYSRQNRGDNINRVFVTGGTTEMEGLLDIISEDINIDIIEIDSFKNLEYVTIDHRQRNSQFAVAVGLGVSEVLA